MLVSVGAGSARPPSKGNHEVNEDGDASKGRALPAAACARRCRAGHHPPQRESWGIGGALRQCALALFVWWVCDGVGENETRSWASSADARVHAREVHAAHVHEWLVTGDASERQGLASIFSLEISGPPSGASCGGTRHARLSESVHAEAERQKRQSGFEKTRQLHHIFRSKSVLLPSIVLLAIYGLVDTLTSASVDPVETGKAHMPAMHWNRVPIWAEFSKQPGLAGPASLHEKGALRQRKILGIMIFIASSLILTEMQLLTMLTLVWLSWFFVSCPLSPFVSESVHVYPTKQNLLRHKRRRRRFAWPVTLHLIIWTLLLIPDPFTVWAASSTFKATGQSTSVAGATNTTSVILVSDTTLTAATNSIVIISGLTGVSASASVNVLDVGNECETIFSAGTNQRKGSFRTGTSTLFVCRGQIIAAGSIHAFGFGMTNPSAAFTSPTINGAAAGSATTVANLRGGQHDPGAKQEESRQIQCAFAPQNLTPSSLVVLMLVILLFCFSLMQSPVHCRAQHLHVNRFLHPCIISVLTAGIPCARGFHCTKWKRCNHSSMRRLFHRASRCFSCWD